MEVEGIAPFRRFGQFQAGQPLKKDRQRDLQFEARERRADAEMDARAESQMRAVGPVGDIGCGIGKLFRIAAGRRQLHAHLSTPATIAELVPQ